MKQDIVQGIAHLPSIIEKLGVKRLFLVAGNSYNRFEIKQVIDGLGLEITWFSGFNPNPVFEEVCEGLKLIKESACDCILAVGGGSAMDVAKCIKLAYLTKEGESALIPPVVSTRVEVDGSTLPFIAIPTTAGSGSESSHNAVMYYEGSKQTVTNDGILPDYALLEPSVLKGLPVYQKKCTMMDALCQGIESWWSVNSTQESYEYSRKTIELIMQNWRAYIFDNDQYAATQIMLGANYSGRAINLTQTTAAHAMSYKITSLYGLPHGHAVASCLPTLWKYMINNMDKYIDPRGQEYLSYVFSQIASAMGASTPTEAIALFRKMMVEMEMAQPVSENREEDLKILSSSVNIVRLKNNPVGLSSEVIKKIYKVVLQ